MRVHSLALALIWLASPALAPAGAGIQAELTSALASVPHHETDAGVSVMELGSRQQIFEQHGDHLLVPASNMKVFVMAAALALLGPDFAFETLLATDGTNLILIGDGDPGFGDEKLHQAVGETITADFERWGAALKQRGLTTMAGDIIIDDSIFDDERLNATWEASDLGKWYAAPVGGLNFNDNCVDITATPGSADGQPVRVTVHPPNSLVNIINRGRTGKGDAILHHPAGTMDYVVSGRCNKEWRFGSVAFPEPGMLAADAMRTSLRAQGIRVAGEIRRDRMRRADGSLPETLTVLGTRRTPLAGVFSRVGKDSQNLFAECLLKRIGYEWARRQGADRPQGTWETGGQAIREILAERGIDVAGLVVADGSGLSRENRCTARQLTDVLAWMNAQPNGSLFRDSLSVAGVDGSLRRRLKELPQTVWAKTGTMRGIRTLSGYVDGADGKQYAFAILFNGYRGPSTPYKEIQDRICRALAESTATGGTR